MHMLTVLKKFASFISRMLKVFILSFVAAVGVSLSFVIMLVFTVAALAGISAAGSATQMETAGQVLEYGKKDAPKTFLAIPISGMILGDKATSDPLSSLFSSGVTYGYEVKKLLRETADKNEVAGVILLIDSPGGTIFGSEAISDGIAYYRQHTDRPVYSYVAGMAASGAYWVASGTDRIIADHGTVSGSIGVIYGPFKYYDKVVSEDGGSFVGGVVTQGGIETTYITAGKSKDVGNPYRKLTDFEITRLQTSVNDSYDEFVKHVSTQRGIPEETIREELGALIYGEAQAQKYKLIDAIGSKEEAFAALAEKVGIQEDEYKVMRSTGATDFWSTVLSSVQRLGAPKVSAAPCLLHSQVMAFHGDVSALCP